MKDKLIIYTIADSFLPNIGGMEKVAENSAIELGKKHKSIIFAPRIKNYRDNLPVEVFRVKSIPIKIPQYIIALPQVDRKLKQFIKKNPPDIIHIHNLATLSKWFAKYGAKHNIPTYLTLHGYIDNDIENVVKSKILKKAVKRYFIKTIKLVPNLIAVSNGCKNYYNDLGFKNVFVVRNSIDKMTMDTQYYNFLKEKYYISENDNVICFVSRLIYIKNIILLIESFNLLKKKSFSFKAIIAGDGEAKTEMQKLVKKYNLTNEVFFIGNITDRNKVASVYSISDLNVFPSIKDSAGLCLGESASQYTPSLVIENCSTAELIIDNVNGFLSKHSAEDFANRIIEIFTEKNKLKIVGENAKSSLYSTWETYFENITNLYKKEV